MIKYDSFCIQTYSLHIASLKPTNFRFSTSKRCAFCASHFLFLKKNKSLKHNFICVRSLFIAAFSLCHLKEKSGVTLGLVRRNNPIFTTSIFSQIVSSNIDPYQLLHWTSKPQKRNFVQLLNFSRRCPTEMKFGSLDMKFLIDCIFLYLKENWAWNIWSNCHIFRSAGCYNHRHCTCLCVCVYHFIFLELPNK